MLLALGILLLLFEVIKGARPGAKYLTDHLLSLIVFGAAAAEFVLWPKFGTSTYFLLTVLALVDFLSGLALRRRRGAVAAPAPACREEERPDKPSRKSSEAVARTSSAAGGLGCRIRADRSSAADARATRHHPQCGLAGSPVTGPAARAAARSRRRTAPPR